MAMIPITGDSSRRRSFPFVNYALILANIAVFVYELQRGPAFTDCFTQAYALVPNDIVHGTAHATAAGCALHPPMPIYLTLITAMFLHAGLLHIAGNMLYLWVFGGNVEDALGHGAYLVFYFFCGLCAFAAQIAFSLYAGQGAVLNLGASGAIAGVLGAYLMLFPGARIRTVVFFGLFFITRLYAWIIILFFIALQLFEAYYEVLSITNGQPVASGGVAFFAHIGGFAVGLLIGIVARAMGAAPSRPAKSYA